MEQIKLVVFSTRSRENIKKVFIDKSFYEIKKELEAIDQTFEVSTIIRSGSIDPARGFSKPLKSWALTMVSFTSAGEQLDEYYFNKTDSEIYEILTANDPAVTDLMFIHCNNFSFAPLEAVYNLSNTD
jgi:hypothetical protein